MTVSRPTLSRRMGIAFALTTLAWVAPASADDAIDARHTMEEASITVDRLREETKKSGELDNALRYAKGVLIVPSLYKAGFIIGGAYGDGVLLMRQPDGRFGDPAFYRMTGGSLGLQIGLQSSAVVFVIRTEKALTAILEDEFKMGANAGIAVGSVGAGAEAATTTHVGNDIVAYSKAAGLFVGGSLEGAVIRPRKDWNAAVYGVDNSDPRAIIQRNGLRSALNLKDSLDRSATAPAGSFTTPAASGAPTQLTPTQPGPVTAEPLPGPESSPVRPKSRR